MKILWLWNLPKTFRLYISKICKYMYMYIHIKHVLWSNMNHIFSHTWFQKEGVFPAATSNRRNKHNAFYWPWLKNLLVTGTDTVTPNELPLSEPQESWASAQPRHGYCSARDIVLGQSVPVCSVLLCSANAQYTKSPSETCHGNKRNKHAQLCTDIIGILCQWCLEITPKADLANRYGFKHKDNLITSHLVFVDCSTVLLICVFSSSKWVLIVPWSLSNTVL